jgi:hypothetical protein
MNRVLEGLIPDIAIPFLDDIVVKGLYTDYDREEALPRIRYYILEYIQNLDRILERIEYSRATIGAKS